MAKHIEVLKLTDPIPETFLAPAGSWNPDYWERRGYTRSWGDAAVRSDFFEILRKSEDGLTHFVILCPTFLRCPLIIGARDPGAWGSY